MIKRLYNNNIFFVKDQLEKEEPLFSVFQNDFNFYSFFFQDVLLDKKNFHFTDDRDNNLIIINKNFYDENQNRISEFLTKLNVINPHFLFLDYKNCSEEELDNIIKKENFFYKLSSFSNSQEHLYNLLIIIFHHIKDLTRLSDYIVNSFQTIVNAELINQQKIKIEQLYKELETLSKIDTLTNVLNRRAFFEALEKEIARTFRDMWRIYHLKADSGLEYKETLNTKYKSPKGSLFDHYGRLSCMMIDIDNFKEINDEYGHIMGDRVLKKVGELLRSSEIFRDNDIVGRYGGEEFVVILPETKALNARIPAERFRNEIKRLKFHTENNSFGITVSIGIAELSENDKNADSLIEKADKALYYAKQHGKDQTVLYDDIANFMNKM